MPDNEMSRRKALQLIGGGIGALLTGCVDGRSGTLKSIPAEQITVDSDEGELRFTYGNTMVRYRTDEQSALSDLERRLDTFQGYLQIRGEHESGTFPYGRTPEDHGQQLCELSGDTYQDCSEFRLYEVTIDDEPFEF